MLSIVVLVGGLLDTVVDTTAATLADNTATGFVMEAVDETALMKAIDRSIDTFAQKTVWQSIMKTAMQQDFSWVKSAAAYSQLYARAIGHNPKSV